MNRHEWQEEKRLIRVEARAYWHDREDLQEQKIRSRYTAVMRDNTRAQLWNRTFRTWCLAEIAGARDLTAQRRLMPWEFRQLLRGYVSTMRNNRAKLEPLP